MLAAIKAREVRVPNHIDIWIFDGEAKPKEITACPAEVEEVLKEHTRLENLRMRLFEDILNKMKAIVFFETPTDLPTFVIFETGTVKKDEKNKVCAQKLLKRVWGAVTPGFGTEKQGVWAQNLFKSAAEPVNPNFRARRWGFWRKNWNKSAAEPVNPHFRARKWGFWRNKK